MQKNAKSRRKDAEKAAVWFAYKNFNAVAHVKSIQTKWQRVDIFGADVASKDSTGAVTYIQVTAGQDSALNARKHKLEKYPWHSTDRVILAQLKQRNEIVNARKKEWFFKIWEYKLKNGQRIWELWSNPILIPREWFSSFKK